MRAKTTVKTSATTLAASCAEAMPAARTVSDSLSACRRERMIGSVTSSASSSGAASGACTDDGAGSAKSARLGHRAHRTGGLSPP